MQNACDNLQRKENLLGGVEMGEAGERWVREEATVSTGNDGIPGFWENISCYWRNCLILNFLSIFLAESIILNRK